MNGIGLGACGVGCVCVCVGVGCAWVHAVKRGHPADSCYLTEDTSATEEGPHFQIGPNYCK